LRFDQPSFPERVRHHERCDRRERSDRQRDRNDVPVVAEYRRKFGDEQSAEIVGCGVNGAEIDRGILEFPPTGGGHSAERNRCG